MESATSHTPIVDITELAVISHSRATLIATSEHQSALISAAFFVHISAQSFLRFCFVPSLT
jgi:hypothetical protein